MKRVIIFLTLFLTMALPAFSSDLLASVGINWQLGVCGGIENRFTPHFGLKADAGVMIFGLITTDAFLVFYLLPEDERFQVNLLTGIPNAAVPFTFNAAMVSFGVSVLGRYNLTDTISMDLRLGEGFPLFFESGTEMIRDIGFPFGLWPDAVLGLNFKI